MIASELVTWSDDYSVNIQAIDEQHKVLVELINRLHVAIVEHRGQAAAVEVIERLSESTHEHFRLEERLMSLTHYPEFEIHRQQHEALIDQVNALQRKLYGEKQPIAFELLHFLKHWLTQHISESDKHFGTHFQTVGRGQYAEWTTPAGPVTNKKKSWWTLW
jgi:hemerythrin